MTRPPDGRDGSTGNSSGRGFLTPAVRRDISDLNRQFLSLALEPALVGDVRFALPEEVRPLLTAGGDGLLARVAACPFTLFQVSLAHGRPGALGSGVEDNRRPLVDAATAADPKFNASEPTYSKTTLFLDGRRAPRVMRGFTHIFGGPTTGQIHTTVVFRKLDCCDSIPDAIEKLAAERNGDQVIRRIEQPEVAAQQRSA